LMLWFRIKERRGLQDDFGIVGTFIGLNGLEVVAAHEIASIICHEVHPVVAGIKPDRRVGTYGFRAWWADKPAGKDLECCDCGWKPDLGTHYRVRH
jgi:hypothetical protein